MKILVVDDSMLIRLALKKILSNLQCEIHEAEDGEKGLMKFKEVMPDITFCDLTMPKMSGFEAIREMFNISSNAKIVVLTADTQKKTIEKVMEQGVYTVINKPPNKEQILSLVDEILGRV